MYLEKLSLKGRTAVVTGGGQGIGLACAQALGEAGARVVVADMMPDRVESAVEHLKGLRIDAIGETLDVTNSAAVAALAEKLDREGGAQVLVNNAGVAKSDVRAEDTSDEHWRFHMAVNLDGLFWCCRAFGRQHAGAAARARSSTSARCPASSSTSRSRNASTTPRRPACII